MQQLFAEWQAKLEHDPDLWTIRYCRPCNCIIWRNLAYRATRAQAGMFPSETMDWNCIRHYVSPADFVRIAAAYRVAFACGAPVPLKVTLQVPGYPPMPLENMFILAIAGTPEHGLALSHQLAF